MSLNPPSTGGHHQDWTLAKENELRCEVPLGSTLTVRLLEGLAEVFGIELARNRVYTFTDRNFAVFTWYGCRIQTVATDAVGVHGNANGTTVLTTAGSSANASSKLGTGGTKVGTYVADNTPMVAYMNTHIHLETRRDYALANHTSGPRVLIVGPPDHGKSSIAQILASYAVRLDRQPIFVDLDVSACSLSVPGTIMAVPLEKASLTVEDGYSATDALNPLVYFFGHVQVSDNEPLYREVVTQLAESVEQRMVRDSEARMSAGLLLNTGSLQSDTILHIISAFNVDVVLVMGHDKLFSSLSSSIPSYVSGRKVAVVKLPTSGGVVTRDITIRKRLRKAATREYFYGKPLGTSTTFVPQRREHIPLNEFTFLRVGGMNLSEGMKIIDTSSSASSDACRLTRIVPTSELVYSVVAVLHKPPEEIDPNSTENKTEISQQLLRSNVAGFISIVQIDTEQGLMTILAPCPGALPSNYLLVGSIKWVE